MSSNPYVAPTTVWRDVNGEVTVDPSVGRYLVVKQGHVVDPRVEAEVRKVTEAGLTGKVRAKFKRAPKGENK